MKILVSFLLFFIVSVGLSQTTDAFVYRAAVLDSVGQGRSNENFEITIRIQNGAIPNDKLQYAERHLVVTDELGWYQVKIGSGETADMYNILSDVDWKKSRKHLYIIVKELEGNVVSNSITEIVDAPTLSFATNVESKALLTLNCFTNLNTLREFDAPEEGDMVCVKGHSSVRDGGEGFFYYKSEMLEADDDGIIIRPKNVYSDKPGRWVRNIDGYININYYGVRPGNNKGIESNSDRIQRAIDFAASNKAYVQASRNGGVHTQGNTIFFPSGEYLIDRTLILRDGIKLLGEGNTLLTAERNASFDYFFKMEAGRVILHMESLRINGNGEKGVGGMYFKAKDGENGTGGLWQSRFENINIVNIDGHGIHLEGGDSMGINGNNDYSLPNQLSVFENVRITRANDDKNSLRMTGYQGQVTFVNCLFLGKRDRSSLGTNVYMADPGGAVVSFINCTIGDSIYGITMDNSSNIMIDNCWFENLYFAIDITSGKSINIFNNRFSNACGYGSEIHTVPSEIPTTPGSCVSCEDSFISVERNYVRASMPASEEAHRAKFIVARISHEIGTNDNTIIARANTFDHPGLSKTEGIVKRVPVLARTIVIDGGNNVAADFDAARVLRTIESTVSGGEEITLRIDRSKGNGIVKIRDWQGNAAKGNIDLNGRKVLEVTHGQEVKFLKVDPPLSKNGDEAIYVLVAVSESN